jgi:glycosyltransferase involved in cell wall biosynthesis
MDVLVFYPSNKRSVQLETLIIALHRRGVRIGLLTTCEAGPLHEFLAAEGIPAHAHPLSQRVSVIYYARQVLYLVRFCRRHRVKTVLSNLQHANLIAVLAQFLMRTRVIAFRHHFNFAFPGDAIALQPNRMEGLFDKVIGRLARTIVVPSSGVYNGMKAVEGADMSRVVLLPYFYDFEQYDKPDPTAVAAIRDRYPARLRLLMISRLVPFKRPALAFSVVRDLVADGLDVRMLVLDDGPERPKLERFIKEHGLEDRITMLGFRPDVVNHMAASDVLVHPSLTEASSSAVKEMALLGRTVIACQGVGDFDDFVEPGQSGYLVPRSTDGSEIAERVRELYADPERAHAMGALLRDAVISRFSLRPEIVDRYLELIGPGSVVGF